MSTTTQNLSTDHSRATADVAWASFPRATVVTIPTEAVASTVTSVRVEGVEGKKPTTQKKNREEKVKRKKTQ
jgi:hypothetical protein